MCDSYTHTSKQANNMSKNSKLKISQFKNFIGKYRKSHDISSLEVKNPSSSNNNKIMEN